MSRFEELLTQENCTDEQRSVINHPDGTWVLQACPGSGKTKTSALRVGYLLQDWPHKHSGIALLSHTNVAVESFTSAFRRLGLSQAMTYPHFVGTLDSFVAKYILLPFGHCVMGCTKPPILIEGREHFTQAYTVNPKNNQGQRPHITDFSVRYQNGTFSFVVNPGSRLAIDLFRQEDIENCLKRFGRGGFYTHEHSRYWVLRILNEIPRIGEVLSRRFLKLIIDEAQDTSDIQEAILLALSTFGINISLIGDPDQAIYSFAGADGGILNRFRGLNEPLQLSVNFRSNNSIVQAIKGFSSLQEMSSQEIEVADGQGAFVMTYPNNNEQSIITAFLRSISELNLDISNSAILFRGNEDCRRIRGEHAQGAKAGFMPPFVKAACFRESGDIANAYKEITLGIFNLMACPENLKRRLIKHPSDKISKQFRRLVWLYLREQLPSASMQGTIWHPSLITSLEAFLPEVSALLAIEQPNQIGRKLPNRDFEAQPMFSGVRQEKLRIDTIHQAKGETLDAVLFFAKKKQLKALFSNDNSEDKRIAYVAMTRAKTLLWLAIPEDCASSYLDLIQQKGFVHINKEAGIPP